MYSVVMALALAGSAEAPDCCHGLVNSCGGMGLCGGCFSGGSAISYGGCYGGGYSGCYGGYSGQGNYYGTPVMPQQGEKIGTPKKGPVDVNLPQPGTMHVTVPTGAKLTIDGYVSTQTTRERILATPPIQPGSEYTYTLVAETTQNGQVVSQSQRITVRPGQVTPVVFTFSAAPVSTQR